ncbi:hypothetical protein EYF80_011935 [Liparis tanakae]|uniref:Collagen alpha-1(XVII) chain n=1 Tax=Liparis tanakae TaxID=230148 RepID=A0A4Z2IJ75_9TELE|nr:hypothetical protein EYF80_011935 [Liparis tanakae]
MIRNRKYVRQSVDQQVFRPFEAPKDPRGTKENQVNRAFQGVPGSLLLVSQASRDPGGLRGRRAQRGHGDLKATQETAWPPTVARRVLEPQAYLDHLDPLEEMEVDLDQRMWASTSHSTFRVSQASLDPGGLRGHRAQKDLKATQEHPGPPMVDQSVLEPPAHLDPLEEMAVDLDQRMWASTSHSTFRVSDACGGDIRQYLAGPAGPPGPPGPTGSGGDRPVEDLANQVLAYVQSRGYDGTSGPAGPPGPPGTISVNDIVNLLQREDVRRYLAGTAGPPGPPGAPGLGSNGFNPQEVADRVLTLMSERGVVGAPGPPGLPGPPGHVVSSEKEDKNADISHPLDTKPLLRGLLVPLAHKVHLAQPGHPAHQALGTTSAQTFVTTCRVSLTDDCTSFRGLPGPPGPRGPEGTSGGTQGLVSYAEHAHRERLRAEQQQHRLSGQFTEDGERDDMFGPPGRPGPAGPQGHKGEPGIPSARYGSLEPGDFSNMAVQVTDYIKSRGLLHDIVREYNSRVFQGPPGPPGPAGPPGHSRWSGSSGNATDLLGYIKSHGLLRDVDRNHNELQGPPGPPGPPGHSRLFGVDANVTDLVEYMKSKDFTKRKDEVAQRCETQGF